MIWQQSKTIVNNVWETDLIIRNEENEKETEWLLCIYDTKILEEIKEQWKINGKNTEKRRETEQNENWGYETAGWIKDESKRKRDEEKKILRFCYYCFFFAIWFVHKCIHSWACDRARTLVIDRSVYQASSRKKGSWKRLASLK